MYYAQGEFEGALNSIGMRQKELIKSNGRMLEWFTNHLLGYKTVENTQASIFDFALSQVGYKFEPFNLKSSKSHPKKKKRNL